MKKILLGLTFLFSTGIILAQDQKTKINTPDPSKEIKVVEASCGACQFHLHGPGCNLAVRINGKAYYVTGASINDYGDAHADNGFCNAVRKAEVQGTVVKNKFKVTYFKLLPE